MLHSAAARLTLARNAESIVIPHLKLAAAEAVALDEGLQRKIAAALGETVAVFEQLGLQLVRKERWEFVEYLLERGIVAGGSALGNYAEDQIIKHIFRNTAIFTPPATIYVGLWTAAPGEANDSGTEVSGGSYARVGVGTTSGWSAPSDGATDNAADTDFGTAGGSWGTVSHVDLSSASSGSANRYFYGALTASKTVGSGDSFKFATGALDVAVA